MGFGASLVTTVWDHRQAAHHEDLIVHRVNGDPPRAAAAQRLADLHNPSSGALLADGLDRKASVIGVIGVGIVGDRAGVDLPPAAPGGRWRILEIL